MHCGIPQQFAVARRSHQRSATMLPLKPRQSVALGETLRELANLAAAALILGQFVGQQTVSRRVILMGTAVWIAFVRYGLVLEGRGR